jgi:hypothetical protein
MWSLYEILANEANGGVVANIQGAETPEHLYEQDMEMLAPTVKLTVPENLVDSVRQLAKVQSIVGSASGGNVVMTLLITSSKWTTVRMALHIDGLFHRLATDGVSLENGADVHRYWVRWRSYLNDKSIALYDAEMSEEEYRETTPWCEACGEYVGNGRGHLDHIKTRGAAWGEEKQKAADWLHLCPDCHVFGGKESKHDGGVESFVKRYPHLRKKVESALRRNVGDDPGKETT